MTHVQCKNIWLLFRSFCIPPVLPYSITYYLLFFLNLLRCACEPYAWPYNPPKTISSFPYLPLGLFVNLLVSHSHFVCTSWAENDRIPPFLDTMLIGVEHICTHAHRETEHVPWYTVHIHTWWSFFTWGIISLKNCKYLKCVILQEFMCLCMSTPVCLSPPVTVTNPTPPAVYI